MLLPSCMWSCKPLKLLLTVLGVMGPCWATGYYQTNRSVDDAVILGLNLILHNLCYPGNDTRILFVDFNAVFNTSILANKTDSNSDFLNFSLF